LIIPLKKPNSSISALGAKFVAEQVGIRLIPYWVKDAKNVVEQDGAYFQTVQPKVALLV
jgi:hypothetical protein